MKYIQITDLNPHWDGDADTHGDLKQWLIGTGSIELSNIQQIKKFSIINHSPDILERNLYIWTEEEYETSSSHSSAKQFSIEPNQIFELTENFINSYNIKAFAVYNNMKFNLTIGYED